MAMDYYSVLGVKKNASASEIKRAYKRLARKFHPDLNPNDKSAEEQFKNISEAYAVLGDPEKRKVYDQLGPHRFDQYKQSAYQQGQNPFAGFDFSNFDFDLGGKGGKQGRGFNFENLFSEVFSHGNRQPRETVRPQKGQDIQYPVEVDFFQAIEGMRLTISFKRMVACPVCNGSGMDASAQPVACDRCGGSGKVNVAGGILNFSQTCPKCHGTGRLPGKSCRNCHGKQRVAKQEKLQVKIPAGVDTGSKIRVSGKGNDGVNGGGSGDLFIIANVKKHPYFERRGVNIYTDVPITFREAILGAKIEVPTLDGVSKLRVPPKTSCGQVLRLRGKGVMDIKSGRRGNHYVKILIQVPQKVIDLDTKQLIEELERRVPYAPRREIMKYATH